MNKLASVFQNKKALIAFVVADDPDFDATVDNVLALAAGGASLIEIGIPFSDPAADGPVIQDADLRAFKAGVTPEKVFQIVAAIREKSDVPLVFLSYLNIIFKYGYDAFCKRCRELAVDGLIIPDMPYEERDAILPAAEKYDISLIPLIAPTSGQRIAKIAQAAQGFVYVVSSMGVTGMRDRFQADLSSLLAQIRQYTDLPLAIGFGVHTAEQARQFAEEADGVIIGSAFVQLIAKHGQEAAPYLKKTASEITAVLPDLTKN